MKRIISLLCCMFLLFALGACNKKNEQNNNSTAETLATILENDMVVMQGQENVFPKDTVVNVEKVSDGDSYTVADTALKETAAKFELYDITAKSDNVAVQPNGTVKATFHIPDAFDPDKVAVVYIAENGTVETLSSSVNKDSKTVTAELSHFSLYAVIETIAETTESTPSETSSETESTESTTDKPAETSKPTETQKPAETSKPTEPQKPTETTCNHKIKYTFENIADKWSHTGQCTLCNKQFGSTACEDKNKDNKCDACSAKMDFGTAYNNTYVGYGLAFGYRGSIMHNCLPNDYPQVYDAAPVLPASYVLLWSTGEIKQFEFWEEDDAHWWLLFSAADVEKTAKEFFNIDDSNIQEMRALQCDFTNSFSYENGKSNIVNVYDGVKGTYSQFDPRAGGGSEPPELLGYTKNGDEYTVYYGNGYAIKCTYTDKVKVSGVSLVSKTPANLIKF